MPSLKYLNRLKYLDYLISHKITGTPKQLADKFEFSERLVYEYINDLRELGAEIRFDKCCNSYVYTSSGQLIIEFKKN